MANTLKLKRSSVQGKIPLTTDLELGEIAINTYDGKIFIKKNDGTETVIEVGTDDFQIITVSDQENIIAGEKADTLNITQNANSDYENVDLTTIPATNNLDISFSDTPEFLKLTIDPTGSTTSNQGEIAWNVNNRTIDINLGNGVVGQMFEEVHYPLVKNITGSTIPNGTPVAFLGIDIDNIPYVGPYIADGTYEPNQYCGITTEDILNNSTGKLTHFGKVRNIDTSSWNVGDILYCSAETAGELTNIQPVSPNYIIQIGFVCKSATSINDGTILVRRQSILRAFEVPYTNTESELIASNVQSAIDELELKKADVSLLSSNITTYRTRTLHDTITGYYRLVTSPDSEYYEDPAVDVSTGSITTTNQLLASYVSEPGLFVGNPGVIAVTTILNIRKTSGNSQQYASFYFELYKRDSLGNETLEATSSSTGIINPSALNVYSEYTCSAILNNGIWSETDRIVIKSYGNLEGISGPVYDFQFGGDNPFRNLFPVPVSVIPTSDASGILVSTDNFDRILSGLDDDVQTALETIDDNAALKSITISAGSGLSGGGDISTNRTISHADTSSVSNISQTSRIYVDSLTFDTYGHVTGYTTSTVNNIVTTDNAVAKYNGTTGEIQNSNVIIDDSGNVTIPGEVKINTNLVLKSSTSTTSTISETIIDSFDGTTYNSAKYIIKVKDTVSGEIQLSELLIIHDGTTASGTEYGIVYSGSDILASFNVVYSSGNINIITTASSTNLTNYTINKQLII